MDLHLQIFKPAQMVQWQGTHADTMTWQQVKVGLVVEAYTNSRAIALHYGKPQMSQRQLHMGALRW